MAEELHFSRAAEKLFIAQQALSKQIRELESELGTELLRRNTRSVSLTPAGQAFLDVCRDVLARLDAGARTTREMGRAEAGAVQLGFFVQAALELTTPILTEFQRRCPKTKVEMRGYSFLDPSAGLMDGSSDLAFVRLPIAMSGLETEVLFVEPRVLAVAIAHPLATRERLHVADLLDVRLTVSKSSDQIYRNFWTLADHRTGPMREPIETTTHAEELEIVATGQACSITAAGAARFSPHAGVRFVQIDDIPGVACALAWRSGQPSSMVRHFIEVARDTRSFEAVLIQRIEHPEMGDDASPPLL